MDEQIAQIEARLDELRPAVDEAAALERALKALKRERDRLGATEQADPRVSDKARTFEDPTQRYISLPERQRQILEIIRKEPGLLNTEIAERLGITPTRVGQVRRTLD